MQPMIFNRIFNDFLKDGNKFMEIKRYEKDCAEDV